MQCVRVPRLDLYNNTTSNAIVKSTSNISYRLLMQCVRVPRLDLYNNTISNAIVKSTSNYSYKQPVTVIRGRFYNSIADGIIVQIKSWYTCTNYDNCVVLFVFVYPRPISCVPNVADVSGLFIRVSLTFIYYISLLYINSIHILHILKLPNNSNRLKLIAKIGLKYLFMRDEIDLSFSKLYLLIIINWK
jgi:hypothetical protein